MKGFLTYTTSAEGQQAAAQAAGSAPLPDDAAHADHPGRHRHHAPEPDAIDPANRGLRAGAAAAPAGGPHSRPTDKEAP